MPSPLDPSLEIRLVPQFEEPRFTRLAEQIFGDQSRHQLMTGRMPPEEQDGIRHLRSTLPPRERVRIGAFHGENLVGWCHGWFDGPAQFYMANSAVLPDYRRQGVYSALVMAMVEEVGLRGVSKVFSHHVATNNPVLIAKLKLGFVFSGMSFSEEMGMLVQLSYFIYPERLSLYRERTTPLKATGHGD